jgi:hypothetical protein
MPYGNGQWQLSLYDGWLVSCAYDPPATPTLFLIWPDGRVQFSGQGSSKADLNALAERIAGHLGV